MGMRTRELAGPLGCQHEVNGEKCHREENATVHRQNFGKPNHSYHEYVAPKDKKVSS